jgi:hypothetical protein
MGNKKNLPLESVFQDKVLKKLREIPHSWWVKINDRTTVGLPDILGFCAGVGFAIELKTKSKLSAIQAYTLRKIDHSGAQTFVCTPDNVDEVLDFIRKVSLLGNKKASSAGGR